MVGKIKSILKKSKAIMLLWNAWADARARRRLSQVIKRQKRSDKERKIRILFIVIDPNTWNKSEPLYRELKTRDNVELFMVCVPLPYGEENVTYEFFRNAGYDCIDARSESGEWFDLAALKPDYIFYGEPYNNYLPKSYRSNVTSAYSKICIVTYGMTIAKEFLEIRPRNFYRDVYLCYANNADEAEYNIKQFPKGHERGIQHTKDLGFLGFSSLIKAWVGNSPSWNFSHNEFRAIWTPRWTTDNTSGGSNFFRYKDLLFDYAEENKDADILFRPHPMALNNFVKQGLMTRAEAEEFKLKCAEAENVSLDEYKDYTATFWGSDVLISDISSIMVEYFITGKPIIYCRAEGANMSLLPFFNRILECNYVVDREEELISTLNMLKAGNDPLLSTRKDTINRLFGQDKDGAARRIAEDIVTDFKITES